METVVRVLLQAVEWLYLQTVWAATVFFYKEVPPADEWDVVFDHKKEVPDVLHLVFLHKSNRDGYSEISLLILKESREDKVTFVGVGQSQMDVGEVKREVMERCLNNRGKVQHVRVHLDMKERTGLVRGELLSCVSVAKRMMGVREPLVQTPEQLMAYLWRVT